MILPEILAPAGGWEQLTAAVRSGADAVYLGAGNFNARRNAKNFDADELLRAAFFCRERGVKIYLAMNTLVRDDEFENAMNLFEYACKIPVDAVIVQDLGLAGAFKKAAPEMRIHASTQMSVHTPEGVREAKKSGFSRVVLARELSCNEIEEISEVSDIETEVFVHGALCMSVSGQCYMSSVLGSRSGNRGFCAQPCRLPFRAHGVQYALSLKDLSLFDHMEKLKKTGVSSLKIEGRMKRPEYVAAAVTACRMARDEGNIPCDLSDLLKNVFSRSGFTDGYFMSNLTFDMFGHRRHEDVTASEPQVMKKLSSLYQKERQSIPVKMVMTVKRDNPISLAISDPDGNRVKLKGAVPQIAEVHPLDSEKAEKQLSKTGGTYFFTKDITLNLQEGLTLSAASINELRREALLKLSQKRAEKEPFPYQKINFNKELREKKAPKLRGVFESIEQIPQNSFDFEIIFLNIDTPKFEIEKLVKSGLKIGLELPRAMFSKEKHIEYCMNEAMSAGAEDVLIHNIGAFPLAAGKGFKIHAGFGMNVFNSRTLESLSEMGAVSSEVSFENSLRDISKMSSDIPVGLIVYGYLPMMLTRSCPLKRDESSCKNCKKKSFLKDRLSKEFCVKCESGIRTIYNTVPLSILDRLYDANADFHIMRFTGENKNEVETVINAYKNGENPFSSFTRGSYYRGAK